MRVFSTHHALLALVFVAGGAAAKPDSAAEPDPAVIERSSDMREQVLRDQIASEGMPQAARQRPILDAAVLLAVQSRPPASLMQQRRAQLEPEYYRRVQRDGKASADRWLKQTAFELGRQDGEALREQRAPDRPGITTRSSSSSARPGITTRYGQPSARPGITTRYGQPSARPGITTRYKQRSSRDEDCARVEYKLKNVPNPFGGPMKMVQVPECVSE